MKILGVDTTGKRLSVALSENSNVLYEVFGDETKKHLETLMPCIDELLNKTSATVSDIDLYALSAGPGSFTGIRIGAAAVQAMAQKNNKQVVQVDTLDALCRNIVSDSIVCAMIDARHDEVFAKAKRPNDTVIESTSINIDELLDKLKGEEVVFVGDGAIAYSDRIHRASTGFSIPEGSLLLQTGKSVCTVGYDMFIAGLAGSWDEITPKYMKLSQAERYKKLGR